MTHESLSWVTFLVFGWPANHPILELNFSHPRPTFQSNNKECLFYHSNSPIQPIRDALTQTPQLGSLNSLNVNQNRVCNPCKVFILPSSPRDREQTLNLERQ